MSDKFRIPEKKHKQPQEFRNSLLSEAKQNNYFLMSTDLSGDVNKSKLKEHVLLGKKCMSLKSL